MVVFFPLSGPHTYTACAQNFAVLQDAAGDNASGVTQEQYLKHVCEADEHLGFSELLAFIAGNIADGNIPPMQLWMAGQTEPIVICSSNSRDSSSNSSRRNFVYNLLAVSLPKSQKVVWLPLVKTGYTNIDKTWRSGLLSWTRALLLALQQRKQAARESTTPLDVLS